MVRPGLGDVSPDEIVFGRQDELTRIRDLVASATHGRGGVLLVTGEAGAGKTVMARCTTQVAEGQGLQVLTCTGRPDEAELAFAGLADLMRPLYPYLSQMPAPQAEALRAALGLGPAAESDRFVVFASALTLLLQAAAAVPTVIVADNLHLLDAPTRDVLAFVARRVLDEPVGMVLTLTDPSEGPDFEASDPWSSVPVLRLAGLQPAAANDLVTRALDRQVPHRVVASLVDRTGGNPLALLQLVSALESDMLPDVAHAALALPMPQVAVRIFGPRLDELDAKAFDVLALTCAYDPPVPTSVLFDAAERVGFGAAEFETLAGQGFIEVRGREVRVLHPLLRSAVLRRRGQARLRAAHRVFAETFEARGDTAKQAWHLARAAFGPDAAAAAALESAAEEAASRAGYASAQTLLEKAAELSPGESDRARRLQRAGEYARTAGDGAAAKRLVTSCLELPAASEFVRGEGKRTLGRLHMQSSHGDEACDLLVEAATHVREADPARAAHILCEAAIGALLAQDETRALELLAEAHGLTEAPVRNVRLAVVLVTAMTALRQVGRCDESMASLSEALHEAAHDQDPLNSELVIYLIRQSWFLALPACRDLIATLVGDLRRRGGLSLLPFALYTQAYLDVRAGHLASAAATGAEATRTARDTGNDLAHFLALGVEALAAAWQGAESLCRERAESAAALRPKLETLVLGEYTDALGHLELSKANYETAVAHLDHPKRDPRTGLADLRDWSSGELAEALIRLGRPLPIEMAERASSYADSNVTSGAALACRLQGIQALEEFSLFFERSAAAFREASCPTEQARTLLCHAERLRRAGEKVAARELLQAAQATFEACGARIWARRTAQELAATGLHLQRSHQPTQTLTPQEHQVATLVAQGATNKDVALALFISAKTVEAHLSRVYRKLGVNRRSQLAHRFTPQAAALPGGRQ